MESTGQLQLPPQPASPSSSDREDHGTTSSRSPSTTVETSSSSATTAYPIRRRRNPAVLIRWIEEHPFNPYPTKAEKQGLAFYAGMTQRQLNDWFANARRNIKKVGYDNWKKKHSGFSAILSGIPLAGNSCNFPVLATASSSNSHHTFTIAPLNRPSLSNSLPNTLMSYAPSLANMAAVKHSPLQNPSVVKVEGGCAPTPPTAVSPVHYYSAPGGYSLSAVENSLSSPCSSASPACHPTLPFPHENFYQLASQNHAAATSTNISSNYPPIFAVETGLRSFTTPTTGSPHPYAYACDQAHAPLQHQLNVNMNPGSAVLYNWTAPVGSSSTTALSHGCGFGMQSATLPQATSGGGTAAASNPAAERLSERACKRPGAGEQQAVEHDGSPQDRGYYSSSATSPQHRLKK